MAPQPRSSKPPAAQSPSVSNGIKKLQKPQTKRGRPRKDAEKGTKLPKEVMTLENGLLNLDVKAAAVAELTQSNARSPLLSLPGELRNQIWEYALDKSCKFYHYSYYLEGKTPRMRTRGAPRNWLGLLRSCRQIYSETVFLPFQLSKFFFPRYVSDDVDFLRLELLPGQVAAISHLSLGACQLPLKVPPLLGLKELVIFGKRALQCDEHVEEEEEARFYVREAKMIADEVKVHYEISCARSNAH